MAVVKVRTCRDCPRTLYGPGARCPSCQAIARTNRRADWIAGPPRPRIRPSTRCPEHLDWIRSLPCTIPGCRNPSEAAHVRQNTGGGMGLKPPDRFCVPLCGISHHPEQHQLGHSAFDAKYSVCLRAEAERLAAASPFLP